MASPSLNPAAGQSGTNSGTNALVTSGTLTTTVTNTIIIAVVYWDRNAATVSSVKSVTGGANFTRLGGILTGATTTIVAADVWFLGSSGTFSDTIQATLSSTPGNGVIHVFGVQGCAGLTLGTGFDPNGALPATATGTTSPSTVTYSTTNADDLIIAAVVNGSGSSGASGAPAVPTGFTNILTTSQPLGSGSINVRTSLLSVAAAQTNATETCTIAATVNQVNAIVFALTADGGLTLMGSQSRLMM